MGDIRQYHKGQAVNTGANDASNVIYNNTNVKSELDSINQSLSDLFKTKTETITLNSSGVSVLNLNTPNVVIAVVETTNNGIIFAPYCIGGIWRVMGLGAGTTTYPTLIKNVSATITYYYI